MYLTIWITLEESIIRVRMINFEVWGSQSGGSDDLVCVGRDAVSMHEWLSWFGRNVDDLNSEWQNVFRVHVLAVLRVIRKNLEQAQWLNTGLFEMIVGVITTCHTQYTWDRSICIFLFNRTTFQVCVTYLRVALYVYPLWFYKHQHDSRVRSKLFVACQRWWFRWRFWFVPSVPIYLREEEEHKPDPWSVQLHTPISSVLCMSSC